MEAGIAKGSPFHRCSRWATAPSLGRGDPGHLDESFDPATSSSIKLLYIETISKPQMLLKHAASLIRKGCRIAAIKAGRPRRSRAASRTPVRWQARCGVDALFARRHRALLWRKTCQCCFRFTFPELTGKNMAIITMRRPGRDAPTPFQMPV